MAMTETQQKLEQWGRWLSDGTGLGYGNVLGRLRSSGLPLASISDDHAIAIDRVIAVLKQTNYEQYQCIKLSYGRRMSNRVIGRELGIGSNTVQRRIEAAERWLDIAFELEKV